MTFFSPFSLKPDNDPNYDMRSRWHNLVPHMKQVRSSNEASKSKTLKLTNILRSWCTVAPPPSAAATCSTPWSLAVSTRWSYRARTGGDGPRTLSHSSSPQGQQVREGKKRNKPFLVALIQSEVCLQLNNQIKS